MWVPLLAAGRRGVKQLGQLATTVVADSAPTEYEGVSDCGGCRLGVGRRPRLLITAGGGVERRAAHLRCWAVADLPTPSSRTNAVDTDWHRPTLSLCRHPPRWKKAHALACPTECEGVSDRGRCRSGVGQRARRPFRWATLHTSMLSLRPRLLIAAGGGVGRRGFRARHPRCWARGCRRLSALSSSPTLQPQKTGGA